MTRSPGIGPIGARVPPVLRGHPPLLALVLALGLVLGGCGRGADSGATANPNAPGRPGTGNPPETAAPQQPDTRAGGSAGPVGVVPPTEASGGELARGRAPPVPPAAAAAGASGPRFPAAGASGPMPAPPTAAESRASMPTATQGGTRRGPGSTY